MPELRAIPTGDDALLEYMLALNNAAVPAVNELDSSALARLIDTSAHTLAMLDADALLGFIVLFSPGADYESENYTWFSQRAIETGRDFLYVDRVVVAPANRSAGVGGLLYDRVFELAGAAGRAEVTCEVNLDPPNPRSMAFHERRGFARVGRQVTKGGAYTVALLAAAVEPTTARL